jgi:type VI secretion system protein ImpB
VEALPKLKERKFVEIDRDNFSDVMASCAPRLALRVDNQLADDDTKLNVELNFRTIDDFNPAEVVKQVEPLRKLFDARQRLMDLLAKLDGNDKLDALLQEIAENPDSQKALKDSTAAPAA